MTSYFTTLNAAAQRLRLLILLCAVGLLSGCASYGPVGTPDFDPTYSRTLEKGEQLLFSAATGLTVGTYMEEEEELFQTHQGRLLMTSERMLFVSWNQKQRRYEPLIWTGYSYISQAKKHNNVLLQYIAIVATDGSKFTYHLNNKSVEEAYTILMEFIRKNHKPPSSDERI